MRRVLARAGGRDFISAHVAVGALEARYAALIDTIDEFSNADGIITGIKGLAAGQQGMGQSWATIVG